MQKKALLFHALLVIVLLLNGCGGAGRLPTASTPQPTATVPVSISAGAFDFSWLQIKLPDGWRETAPSHYEGEGGYAWLELRDSQGAGPGAVCMGEANGEKPDRYGAYPEIRDLRLAEQPACLILPSSDQPTDRKEEALYLLWLPKSLQEGKLLALHADREHIEGIVAGLGFTQPVVMQTASPCDFSIAGSPVETTQQGSLRVDAFPIARGSGCSPYREAAEFNQRMENGPSGLRSDQVKERQWSSERLARLNKPLELFGFFVETYGDHLYRVVRAGKEARSNLSWVGPVSVRADEQDFILPVLDGYNAVAYLVRPDGLHALEDPNLLIYDQVFPVYSGANRISLRYDYERYPRPYASPALLEIYQNDTLIDTLSISGANPAKGPVHGLWSWKDEQGADHWTLDTSGLVIQDGKNLNQQLGTPEILAWRLVKEKPFFFFRKDGQVHISFNGQALPGGYDDVIAEPQYSDRILVQMRAYESGLVFYAQKGGVWYLVVVEAE